MHSTDELDDGYMGSGKRLRFSINYHGKDNHTKEILEYCDTREELRKREEEIVNEELLTEDLCMNLMTGGYGGNGFWSEEHKQAFINSGGPQSFAKRLKTDPEFFKRHSEVSSKRMKKTHSEGKIRYDTFTGKKHTKETKKKMSEAKKKIYDGENNPSYGTCWITNEVESKKINKGDTIPEGWRLGRKMK